MKPEIREVLRYLRMDETAPEEQLRRVAEVGAELEARLHPRWVWKSVRLDGNCPLPLTGTLADTMLQECGQAVILCCTLGAEFDALLRSGQARDMARAVIADAWGSAWVETACDEAEREIASRFPGWYLTDRFSPGYGDLPLSLQGEICAFLDAPRRLGVHVTDTCLLNPRKSVTAVIGLAEAPQMARIRGCEFCSVRENCSLRKGGKRCAL